MTAGIFENNFGAADDMKLSGMSRIRLLYRQASPFGDRDKAGAIIVKVNVHVLELRIQRKNDAACGLDVCAGGIHHLRNWIRSARRAEQKQIAFFRIQMHRFTAGCFQLVDWVNARVIHPRVVTRIT